MSFENQELQNIINVDLEKEMKKSYIDYAMSVIVGRALPDVRDGLKPVHRRILYTMYEDGLTSDKPFRKSATTVGAVLGRYHPHGDAAVYDSLVRMAQDFSLRYPMIDGHGNFGSVDGDPPAAYRYTEARMSRLANEMLADIDKETVDFMPNFDERLKEPVVLPSRFPSLLVNGSSGIAVGMATNIPPHNLREVIDGVICLIDNPEADLEMLMEHIKGPDFPTGGIIMGKSGIRSAYATGRGKLIVRCRAEIEEKDNKFRIVVTELPYQVNKARLIENIADHVKDKRIEGISGLRDESDREGMKIVIELKRDANPQVVLNQLYKFTQMQDTFSIIMLALVDNQTQPRVLNLHQILTHYIKFQEQIIVRRTRYDLKKAEARQHILLGLLTALDHIDEVIHIIRTSYDNAKTRLMETFDLSDIQAGAILDMRLARLQGLEREKIQGEYDELCEKIKYYNEVLGDEQLVLKIVKDELIAIRDRYGDERRTAFEPFVDDIDYEDMIEREDCVITRTHLGYIKRQPVSAYRAQRRGGRGITAMTTREEDFVEELFVASTHSYILFFTDRGQVYRLKCYMIPEAGRTAKGTNIVNLLQLRQDEKISAVIHLDEFEEDKYLTMVTRNGTIKRTALMEYNTARKGGVIGILLEDDDELVGVKLTGEDETLLLATKNGRAIRFKVSDVRRMGRPSHGVRGMELRDGDYVIGICNCREGGRLLTVTENGYGKRTEISEYKVQNRGGKGITNYNLTDKTGLVAGVKVVEDEEDIILISSDGVVIRMAASEIPVYSRVTQGVRVMRLEEGVTVVTLARTDHEEPEEDGGDAPDETPDGQSADTAQAVESAEE
ncbi:DNA gyrase subunit A [Feifania hominis]|uniref:DNA gyrase subunit A n=1 Tax=Feifania hominis TaxID=2763660 RepID=A0A926HU24_9FIRM|nr:DNA gyrase subunit A [Feifania hominis]MBC8536464.1 DNA gyrase subunit A [Feifania hominis]